MRGVLAPAKAARQGRRIGRRRQREVLSFYLFISPWLAGFLVLTAVPLVLGFVTSLTNYDGYNINQLQFVGTANYKRAFQERQVWSSLRSSMLFSVFNVPLGLVLAFGLAILVNRLAAGRGLVRTLFYIPAIVPVVAGALTWKIIADKDSGLINAVLSLIRPGTAISWLTKYPMAVLVMFVLWRSVGGGMVIFVAGLQGIPRELQEAAVIDGASPWNFFWRITLPLMTPVLLFQGVMGLISSLQVMAEPMLLSPLAAGGGSASLAARPSQDIFVLLAYTLIEIFSRQRFGYGVAVLWILFGIVLVLTSVIFSTTRYWVHYEVEQ